VHPALLAMAADGRPGKEQRPGICLGGHKSAMGAGHGARQAQAALLHVLRDARVCGWWTTIGDAGGMKRERGEGVRGGRKDGGTGPSHLCRR